MCILPEEENLMHTPARNQERRHNLRKRQVSLIINFKLKTATENPRSNPHNHSYTPEKGARAKIKQFHRPVLLGLHSAE